MVKIKGNISNYVILHNDIKEVASSDSNFDRTFFIK